MAGNENDKVILELQKKVDEKRAALKKAARFSPITNCSLELEGQRINLQVLQKDGLIHCLVVLNSYKNSAEQLGLLDQYSISGYPLVDWITDLEAKLAFVTRKEEEGKLRLMENRLSALLSNEKKVELQLEEIMKDLG